MPENDSMTNPEAGFRSAIQFLTRFPVAGGGARGAAASLPWYPAVGALLGLLGVVAGWLFTGSGASILPAAVFVAVLAAASGGLHLDGLADAADAWIGGQGDRERTLAIMKDAMVGPVGVAAILVVLLLKAAAASALFAVDASWTLILAPALGRAAAAALLLGLPYLRDAGLGSAVIDDMPRAHVRYSLIGTAVVAFFITPLGLIAAVGALVGLAAVYRRYLGGVTGDCTGAGVELVETAALLGACLTLSG
jgi:adenosylcobinamide-GDP ribazoletransferase